MKVSNCYIAVLIAFIVSNCTSTTPYPKNWPEISEAPEENCSYLEGTYQNFNGNKYLSDLFGMDYVPAYEDQRIRLEIENGDRLKLVVIENEQDIILYEITAENDEYECENGEIRFKGLRENYFHVFVSATSRAEIKLNAGEDQSIIAEVKHESFSLGFFILPIISNKVVWGRWEKAN